MDTLPSLPAVRLERYEDGPDRDGSYVRGWRFLSGEGAALVEGYVPDAQPPSDWPLLFMFGVSVPLELARQALPHLLAVLSDARLAEALSRWADGLPPME
jgi:hypothetical protein